MSLYNNYPEGFLEEFTEPVIFKLCGIQKDPDNKDGWLMPASKNIPATSRVRFKDKQGVEHDVHLALIRYENPDGSVELDIEGLLLGQMNGGMIQLDPKVPRDVDRFNFINHCHWNKDSKYTFPGAEHIVERFSLKKEAEKQLSERSARRDAMMAIFNLPDSKVKATYAVLGKGNMKSLPEMRNELEMLAEDNPQLVIDKIGVIESAKESGEDMSAEELVALALKQGRLVNQPTKLTWKTSDGKTILKYAPKPENKGDAKEQLMAAIDRDPQIREIVEALVS